MFSWLNFEELLIHNPIELINPSKDTISVAMSQKQYIEFFSNKYTYNGLYYDENMDFCLFYYADPLQSSKEGDVYAQGYIDVEMKIYRVKWLCNVSISRASGLLQTTDGTQGVPQEGGKYTHTAWAYSSDGTDRFSTIYPRFNLLDNTKDFSGTSWVNSTQWQTNGTYKGLTVKSTQSNAQGLFQRFTVPADGDYVFSTYVSSTNGSKPILIVGKNGAAFPSWQMSSGPSDMTRISYLVKGLKKGDVMTARIEGDISSKISVAGHKWEKNSTATPYMPSSSEVTTADGPSYIGQYTNYTLEDSTNPSFYTWREIQEDKWNVTKTEMVVNNKNKTITTVLTGALAECTKDKDITGWQSSQPNANYNYRQPQYSLDIGADDFIISGFGLRGLKNG